MSSTGICVLHANKFRMPRYEDKAHEFRTASSPGGRVVPVVSYTHFHVQSYTKKLPSEQLAVVTNLHTMDKTILL